MKDFLAEKIAYLLPRRVVYWVLVRAWAHYTVRVRPDAIASAVTVFQAMDGFELKQPRRRIPIHYILYFFWWLVFIVVFLSFGGFSALQRNVPEVMPDSGNDYSHVTM